MQRFCLDAASSVGRLCLGSGWRVAKCGWRARPDPTRGRTEPDGAAPESRCPRRRRSRRAGRRASQLSTVRRSPGSREESLARPRLLIGPCRPPGPPPCSEAPPPSARAGDCSPHGFGGRSSSRAALPGCAPLPPALLPTYKHQGKQWLSEWGATTQTESHRANEHKEGWGGVLFLFCTALLQTPLPRFPPRSQDAPAQPSAPRPRQKGELETFPPGLQPLSLFDLLRTLGMWRRGKEGAGWAKKRGEWERSC